MDKGKGNVKQEAMDNQPLKRKAVTMETIVFIIVSLAMLAFVASKMGIAMMFKVALTTAHDIVLNTCFYIMAVAVLAGGVSALMSEFGVIALINKAISPIMRPVYGLPGAASLGAVTTYLSDNPAITALVKDDEFIKYFTKAESVALINLANVFGMGLIVTTYILGLGNEYIPAIIIGNICALVIGGILSIRWTLASAKKVYGEGDKVDLTGDEFEYREVRPGGVGQRVLDSLLEGGKNGVDLGLSIIPGVVIVCTLVMILTFGPAGGYVNGVPMYEGVAAEGIGLLPALGEKISFILDPLFGFQSSEALALPITSLGAVGAAMGMAKGLIDQGLMNAHDICVFAAMGICWAGFLSVQVGQMDAVDARDMIGKSMGIHFVAGLVAGVVANYAYLFIMG